MNHHPHRRAADHDRVVKIGDVIEKWFKPLWPALVIAAGWWATSVRDPIRQIPALTEGLKQVQAQQVRAAHIDSVSIEERRELRTGLMIVIRILCNNARNARDVRCDDIPIPSGTAFPSR